MDEVHELERDGHHHDRLCGISMGGNLMIVNEGVADVATKKDSITAGGRGLVPAEAVARPHFLLDARVAA